MDSKGHQKLTRKKASGGQLLVGAFCRDATAPDNDKAIVRRSAVSPTDRADDSGISLYQPSPEPPEVRSLRSSLARMILLLLYIKFEGAQVHLAILTIRHYRVK